MLVSQNGYSANDVGHTKVYTIPGTTRNVRLRDDECGYLLCHFASWFDANIESIDEGIMDDWGYAPRLVRGSSTSLSNHASGTALDLNATAHVLGKIDTFSPWKTTAIRKQLKVYQGCIRWGGDYTQRKDEMHFEINAPYIKVVAVAALLRSGQAIKSVAVKTLGFVDLSNMRQQSRNGGRRVLPGVKKVQRALNTRLHLQLVVDGRWGPATRHAYRRWQNTLGYHGADADGVPGRDSLTLLGRGRFRVVS